MKNFVNIVKNKARLRYALRDFSSKQIQTVINNIHGIIEERKQQEAEVIANAAQKEVKKKEIIAAMLSAGVTLEDLVGTSTTNKPMKARKPVTPKYRITDGNGQKHEWSGRGIAPKVFKEYFANGGNKESCLIK